MKRTTVDQIMSFGPCQPYTRERVEALWDGRASLSPTEVAALDIPHADRVWALVRLVSWHARVAWACDCAERVLPIWRAQGPEDRRPQDAIRVARAWLRGDATVAQVRDAAIAASAAATSATASSAAAAAYASSAYAANARWHKELAWQLARLVEYAEERVKP